MTVFHTWREGAARSPMAAASFKACRRLCCSTARLSIGTLVGVTAEQLALIATDPQVMHGQAVIAATRVPVSVVLDCIAAGMTLEEILCEYPSVTSDGIRASAAYGALLARDEIVPLPPTE